MGSNQHTLTPLNGAVHRYALGVWNGWGGGGIGKKVQILTFLQRDMKGNVVKKRARQQRQRSQVRFQYHQKYNH